MEYRRFGNKLVARMDKGEEVCAKLLELAEAEDIRLASVSGIGASNDVTLGVFNPYIKEYSQQRYWMSYYELASVTGTLSRKDGEPYLHLHPQSPAPPGSFHTAGRTITAHVFQTQRRQSNCPRPGALPAAVQRLRRDRG